jgi:hypothetical protein
MAGLADTFFKGWAAEAQQQRMRDLVEENHRIKDEIQNVRLSSFDLGAPPKAATFFLDYSWHGAALEQKDFVGPFPAFGKSGQIGRIWVQIPDRAVWYSLISVERRSANESIATVTQSGPAWGEIPPEQKDTWFLDEASPVYGVGLKLKPAIGNLSMRQLLSSMSPGYVFAYIETNVPSNASNLKLVVDGYAKISALFKFYVDLRTKDGDECTSVFEMPMNIQFGETAAHTIALELHRQGNSLDISECEKSPF